MRRGFISVGLTILLTWLTLFVAQIISAVFPTAGAVYGVVVVIAITVGVLLIIFGLISK